MKRDLPLAVKHELAKKFITISITIIIGIVIAASVKQLLYTLFTLIVCAAAIIYFYADWKKAENSVMFEGVCIESADSIRPDKVLKNIAGLPCKYVFNNAEKDLILKVPSKVKIYKGNKYRLYLADMRDDNGTITSFNLLGHERIESLSNKS